METYTTDKKQLKTTSVTEHGFVLFYVIKTRTILVKLNISTLIFTGAENDLLSLLKKWNW